MQHSIILAGGRYLRLLAMTGLLLAGAGAAMGAEQAVEIDEEQLASASAFALNNTQFVLYHEIGHMLVDQFGLPILGRQEDAADNIATYLLLAQQTDEADNALIDAAYGWLLTDAASGEQDMEAADFYDEHSLDLQRAYAIVCLMAGGDLDEFSDIADDYALDDDRRASCQDDYTYFEQSIAGLLGPHLGQGAEIGVEYDTAPEDMKAARELFEGSGILEAAAVTFGARACGEVNAFYDPEGREVVICYELIDDYFNMIMADMLEGNGA